MVFYKFNLALEMYYVGQPWSRRYVILNISQPYKRPHPFTRIALLFSKDKPEDSTPTQELNLLRTTRRHKIPRNKNGWRLNRRLRRANNRTLQVKSSYGNYGNDAVIGIHDTRVTLWRTHLCRSTVLAATADTLC
jgi:hypothetical protein